MNSVGIYPPAIESGRKDDTKSKTSLANLIRASRGKFKG